MTSDIPATMPKLVIDTQAHPYSHTTTFVHLEDGRNVHASFRASNYSEDGGLKWFEIVEMRDINGGPVGGSCINLAKLSKTNAIGLTVKAKPDPNDPRRERCQMLFWRSDGNSETWTRPQPTVRASSTTPSQLRTLPNEYLLCVRTQQTIKRGQNAPALSARSVATTGTSGSSFRTSSRSTI